MKKCTLTILSCLVLPLTLFGYVLLTYRRNCTRASRFSDACRHPRDDVSLFSARMGFLRSGQIRCPVIVIASTGDPLFPFDVVQRLYHQIKAPSKELLVFDLEYHLLFNECLNAVLPRLVEALKHSADKQAQVAETSEKAGSGTSCAQEHGRVGTAWRELPAANTTP